jgi:hypothetical protein
MNSVQEGLRLAQVARRLDGAGIPWVVFAGAAATVYGASRPLTDVDILVPAAERDRVAALFPEARTKSYQDGRSGLVLPGIDILPGLDLMDLDAAMIARSVRQPIAGVSVPVIPAEDNILLKAMWGRGANESKHDWEDVEAMMAHLPVLDWEYLRWRASSLAPRYQITAVMRRLETLWHRLHQAQG